MSASIDALKVISALREHKLKFEVEDPMRPLYSKEIDIVYVSATAI